MKLSGIFLLAACLQVSAAAYSQKITLSEHNITLEKMFRQIKKQTGYMFLYNNELLQNAGNVSVSVTNASLETVLEQCFKNQPVTYEIVEKTIIVKPKAEAIRQADEAPPVVVTGKITDEKGEALPGVGILLKGTQVATSTNPNGEFSISVPEAQAQNAVLVITYIGYQRQEVPVNGRTSINLKLTPDVQSLNEVVVVGYNTVKKSDLTGAVASVTAEEIRKMPAANALEAMQGRAAGVDITSNERPGEIGSIRIRGVRSLTATSDPLYVVDGVPLAAGGIEAINPKDIESIDILKDASATAIYGSRGANGVVLITTKRGKAGALSLNYQGTATIETLNDRTEMMNSAQYVDFRRDAYRRLPTTNANRYPEVATRAADSAIFSQDPYAWRNIVKGWQNGTWNGSLVPTTDWTGMVTQTGITQDHLLSASGGTEKMKAYGSFGYLSQKGTQVGQDYNRYNAKFSVDIKPLKWFAMGGNILVTNGIQNYGFSTTNATGPGSIYFAAQGMLPYAVPYDDNGNRINLPGGDINILNPVDEAQYCINERKVLRTMGNLYAEVNLLKGLKYRINFGPDFYNLKNGRWMDAGSINRGGGEPGSTNYAQLNQTSRVAWTLDNLLYYDKTFADVHHLGVTLLQSASSFRDENSSMTATNLPWDSQKWYQLNSVSTLDRFGSGLTQSSLTSYMARVNYDYKNKYLLTASGRWDGASQLAEGNKWDFFPSAAVAWRLDQEDFLKNTPWINLLKLRLGVGSTGNAAVDPYTTKGPLQTLYYTWGSTVVPGYVASDPSQADPVQLANLQLGWEHTAQWNLGIDFDFFKGRLNGAVDLYTSRTTDLLMDRSIPSVTGYTSTLANIGITANRGIDLTLNSVNIRSNDFSWSTSLNLSANKDRIVELSNGKEDNIGNLWFIDERLNVYYDYVKEGIWQDTPEDQAEIAKFAANGSTFKPGDIKIADLNGDYKIDPNNDKQIVGHSSPDLVAGLTNTFEYKNFTLSFFLYSRWGYTIATGAESLQGRFAQRVVDYWTPDNPTNDYPSPNYNSAAGDPYKSSMNYQDGSFIKIRNISLGYNLPKSLSSKLKVSDVRIYAQAMNPGLIYSKVDWIDPDLGGSTFNRGFVLGLNVGF